MSEVMQSVYPSPSGLLPAREPRSRVEGRGAPQASSMMTPAALDRDTRLREIVAQHFDFVWRSLRGLGVHQAGVDDAAQHVFLVASHKLDSIPVGSERAFLFGTAVGVAANVRRSQQSAAREVNDDDALLGALDHGRNPEEELARREQCLVLERLLDEMPEDLRVVFVLFELEGLTSIEIAALLDLPVGTASSRLRRAREDFEARLTRMEARRGGLS